jgi:hypothetical protein
MPATAFYYITRSKRAILCSILLELLPLPIIFFVGFSTQRNAVEWDLDEIIWCHRQQYEVQFYPAAAAPRPRVLFNFAGLAVEKVFTTMGDQALPDSFTRIHIPLLPLWLVLIGVPLMDVRPALREQQRRDRVAHDACTS